MPDNDIIILLNKRWEICKDEATKHTVHGKRQARNFAVEALMASGIKLPKYGLWQMAFGLAGLAFLIVIIFS